MKISLVGCKNYEIERVRKAVKLSFENLGGIGSFIKPGDRVLIKANLLIETKPEKHVTTHPSVVQAIAEELILFGASVVIGDSPGGPFSEGRMKNLYEVCGMKAAADASGASLNQNFNSFEKLLPDGKFLKKLIMTDMLNDVDKVFSVAKLKTHGMMTYTGAVKNMFGTIPGMTKAKYHVHTKKYDDFADTLIDIYNASNPVLCFIDGITGMEGHGPSGGTPRDIGVIIASKSGLHADSVAAKIISLSETKVPILKQAIKRGFLEKNLSASKIIGADIKDYIMTDFDIPKSKDGLLTFGMFPKFTRKFVSMHLLTRPKFNSEKCVKCGICVKSCPIKTLKLKDGGSRPIYNPAKCIRCYCCQELCPKQAVDVYKPLIQRIFVSVK